MSKEHISVILLTHQKTHNCLLFESVVRICIDMNYDMDDFVKLLDERTISILRHEAITHRMVRPSIAAKYQRTTLSGLKWKKSS